MTWCYTSNVEADELNRLGSEQISDGSNLVRSLMFEAKNRVFKFDYQKMNMFESAQCSKK